MGEGLLIVGDFLGQGASRWNQEFERFQRNSWFQRSKEAYPTRTSQWDLAGTAHLGKLTLNSQYRDHRFDRTNGNGCFPLQRLWEALKPPGRQLANVFVSIVQSFKLEMSCCG